MTFDEAMTLTRTVSSNAAFEDLECRAYFDLLMTLPPGGTICEVGLELGRSSSIALQVARAGKLEYIGIDPFTEAAHACGWVGLARTVGHPFTLHVRRSDDPAIHPPQLHAVLIDGDHSGEVVTQDCYRFLPYVVRGGYAFFHDYGRDSLPEVYPAVNAYMTEHLEWEFVRVADTLGIWRKR